MNVFEKSLFQSVELELLTSIFCLYTWLLGDMEFLFSCSIQYLTRSLRSLVRYRVEHSNRNSISPRAHVLLSIDLHHRGRGRGARTREKNGVLGARDEGTPATKTPIFSSPPTDFYVIQLS